MSAISLPPTIKIVFCLILGIGLILFIRPQAAYKSALAVSVQETSDDIVITPINIVREMLGQVNRDRTVTDLRKLTGEEPICIDDECYTITNRITGSIGLQWAKEYVYEELTNLGYFIEVEDWSLYEYADQNLIARKPGVIHPEEVIYIVAHLDSMNTPGADDNAAGTVDILELARNLNNHSFSRTVVLFFSTGEEQGSLGVKSHISQLSLQELGAIQYVINIDVIGYDANGDAVMELWYGDHVPSLALAQMMSQTIQAYQISLVPLLVIGCG